jgi:RNA polymerase sigma factor for flagellar operon FliA
MTPSTEQAAASETVSASEIQTYLPLVQQTVARFLRKLPPNVLRDDLMAAGMIGLIDSLKKNGKDRGPTFEWYARIRIRGAVVDELRAEDWLSRRARTRATQEGVNGEKPKNTFVRMDDVMVRGESIDFADTTQQRACEQMEARQGEQALRRAIAELSPREKFIVQSHYLEGIQMKVIAKELGVSEPRVSQLHARAVQKLRGFLATAESNEYIPPQDRPTVPARPVRKAA